jgi:hypothetical protein
MSIHHSREQSRWDSLVLLSRVGANYSPALGPTWPPTQAASQRRVELRQHSPGRASFAASLELT